MVLPDKDGCVILAELLRRHGVTDVVVSPGSRNAPLIMAIARSGSLRTRVVIDERSAAFVALGIAEISEKPVALVCTSGTALLNYAPAVAEAFYKHLPLIVVSADRPSEWIDQDDSQTIRQPGALANIVKRTCSVVAECDADNVSWWVNREINDILLTATSRCPGPVHINISIDEPLTHTKEVDEAQPVRTVELVTPRGDMTLSRMRWLAVDLHTPKRVMIVAGFHRPDDKLNKALERLSKLPNVVVLAENISNLSFDNLVDRIDTTLSAMPQSDIEKMAPDVVITFGGALVSRLIKKYLRETRGLQHWHVGVSDHTIDCFKALSKRIDVDPATFFAQLSSVLPKTGNSDYAARWRALKSVAAASHQHYVEAAPWCDLAMFRELYSLAPKGWNWQLSNGTAIRYSQLFATDKVARFDCNRGVSGIDGCTSTAVGASICHDGTTLLVTGDMSAQYDIGALSSQLLSSRLKIIVVCNGGGAIFRFIPSTSSLPELNEYFSCGVNLPLEQLCQGYGIAYYKASDNKEFASSFRTFVKEKDRPALLAVYTDGLLSAEILKGYFNRNKSILTPQ